MVMRASSATVVLDSMTVFELHAVATSRHAKSAVRFTPSI
jgi:hypothetical protein